MVIELKFDCSGVDWQKVSDTLRDGGMAHFEASQHRKAFENSHTTVFAYHDDQLIGFGRAISDGVFQAAIYDVAINPDYQGKGLGRTIMKNIIARLPKVNIILYASPGKEGFYVKLDFRKMKTGMALFNNAEDMSQRGFTQ